MDNTLSKILGNFLAQGYTNAEIATSLVDSGYTDTTEEAIKVLKGFYESWQVLEVELDYKAEDMRNWHLYLRHQLLKQRLADDSVQSSACALRILDSVAELQGIMNRDAPEDNRPIQIELVPASTIASTTAKPTSPLPPILPTM